MPQDGPQAGPRRAAPWCRLLGAFLAVALLSACDGPQSVLVPAGEDASQIDRLFRVMLAGAIVLWLGMNGLFYFITRRYTGAISRRRAEAVILGGGVALPVVVITALLVWGLSIMPDQRAPGDGLRVRIVGEQFWWRVEYWPEGAEAPVVSANELRLPVGQRSEILLDTADVIHAFWIPALGGKMDMIPGRTNRMTLVPTEAGTFRGACTEFCGLSHALMALNAVTLPEPAFADWLAAEAGPARAAEGPGRDLFFREGCGACHALRGTPAQGAVGPDLTHLGSRTSLASGILPMTAEALAGWIRDPQAAKPGAEMPAYDHLTEDELATLAAWLEGLE